MNRVSAILLAVVVLSGTLFGLNQLSDGIPLTGNFYKMDDASVVESQYNSIEWNKTSQEDEYAGSIYLDSFDNLNITGVLIGNKTVNSSSEEVLKLSNPENRSANISFSEDILGVPGGNLSLNETSDLKLRLRENISLQVETINKTYSKDIKVHIPNKTSSVNQTAKEEVGNESTMNQSQNNTAPLVLNLSNNTSRNITSADSLKLVNNRNYTVRIETNSSKIINETKTQIRGNQSLNLNISDRKAIRVRAENRTRYSISYIENYDYSTNASSDSGSSINSTNTNNETQGETLNSSTSPQDGNETNSTENSTLKEGYPSTGGEWVKIESEEIQDFYIFKYEASRKDANSTNKGDSNTPYSQKGVIPWNEISQEKAKQICQSLGDGYSLPSNEQWHAAASQSDHGKIRGNILGGDKSSSKACRTYQDGRIDDICLTGTGPESWQNSANLVDIKGNLWEWTSTVVNTENLEKSGESGYITSFGEDLLNPGLSDQQEGIDNSYYYSSSEGKKAIRRGGGWNSKRLSGLYSTIIDRNPQYSSTAIGFRCVYER